MLPFFGVGKSKSGAFWDRETKSPAFFWDEGSFGIILESLWEHFGIILEPFWNHVGIILE